MSSVVYYVYFVYVFVLCTIILCVSKCMHVHLLVVA